MISRILRNPDHWDDPTQELAAFVALGVGISIFVVGSFVALAIWWFAHH